MAHNIAVDSKTGQHMVFTAGALPWHKLGQNVTDAQTWQSAIELAHLDWEVSKVPLYTHFSIDGKMTAVKIEDHMGVIRQDTREHLGIVGSNYELIQNRRAFDFTEALLETGALYESAGALGNGSRIWVLARIPQADFTIGNGDKHQSFLCFTTAHDGTLSAVVKLTDVRVVCNNTLTTALAGAGASMKIRHTKSAEDRLQAAQRMVSNTLQSVKSLEEKFQLLAKRRLTRESTTSILDRLFPKSDDTSTKQTRRDNIVADVMTLFEKNDGNAFPDQRGTAYALLNAITDYTDHSRTARLTDGKKDMTVDQARAESAIWGTGAKLKETALDVIYQLTDGTEEVRTIYVPTIEAAPKDAIDATLDGILRATENTGD